jgi:SRSO17 transposase
MNSVICHRTLVGRGYGVDTALRTGLTTMGLPYVVGIQSSTSLWPPGSGPLPPKAWSGHGRPPSLVGRACYSTASTQLGRQGFAILRMVALIAVSRDPERELKKCDS